MIYPLQNCPNRDLQRRPTRLTSTWPLPRTYRRRQRVRTPSCWPPSHQPVSWWWVRRRITLTIRFSDSRRHQPSSLISMPVASLPDLELVCAPRSSISTQKYKPKVGGQITLLSPWPKFWGGVPPVPPWSTPLMQNTLFAWALTR